MSKSERNYVKLAWNVSCAHVPVQVNTVQIRCFLMCLLSMEFPRNQGATPLRWDDALKPLDGRTLPLVGEPEPTPLKKNNNNSNQVILTVTWQTIEKE